MRSDETALRIATASEACACAALCSPVQAWAAERFSCVTAHSNAATARPRDQARAALRRWRSKESCNPDAHAPPAVNHARIPTMVRCACMRAGGHAAAAGGGAAVWHVIGSQRTVHSAAQAPVHQLLTCLVVGDNSLGVLPVAWLNVVVTIARLQPHPCRTEQRSSRVLEALLVTRWLFHASTMVTAAAAAATAAAPRQLLCRSQNATATGGLLAPRKLETHHDGEVLQTVSRFRQAMAPDAQPLRRIHHPE
jgi:hypothetical protein